MSIGIQYDVATGIITGSVSPAIDTDVQPMPEGRGQLVIDTPVDYTNMVVDMANKVLVPAT